MDDSTGGRESFAARRQSVARDSSLARHQTAMVRPESVKSSMNLGGAQSKQFTSLVSEETKSVFRKRFAAKQVDGTVSLESFFDILADIEEVVDANGVVYNSNLVTKMYSAAESDNVDENLSLRDCFVAIGRFIARGQEHDKRLTEENAKRMAADESNIAENQFLGFFAYVKQSFSCKRRRAAIFWRRFAPMDRRIALMLTASVAVFAVAACAVGFAGDSAMQGSRTSTRQTTTAIADLAAALVFRSQDSELNVVRISTGALAGAVRPAILAISDTLVGTNAQQSREATRGILASAIEVLDSVERNHKVQLVEPLRLLVDLLHSNTISFFDDSTLSHYLSTIALSSSTGAVAGYTGTISDSPVTPIVFRSRDLFPSDDIAGSFFDTNGVDLAFPNATIRELPHVRLPLGSEAAHAACVTIPPETIMSVSTVTVCLVQTKGDMMRLAEKTLTSFETSTASPDGSTCSMLSSHSSVWSRHDANASGAALPGEWVATVPSPLVASTMRFPNVSLAFGSRSNSTERPFTAAATGHAVGLAVAVVCEPNINVFGLRASETFASNLESTRASTVELRPSVDAAAPASALRNGNALLPDEYVDSAVAVFGAYGNNGRGPGIDRTGAQVVTTLAAVDSASGLAVDSLITTVDEDFLANLMNIIRSSLESDRDAFMVADDFGTLRYTMRPSFCGGDADCEIPQTAADAFYLRRRVEEDVTLPDNNRYLLTVSYVGGANVVVGVATKHSALVTSAWTTIAIMLAVASVVIFGCGVAIYFLTGRVLQRIESEYVEYKTQIENEKMQFSELVKDVMPSFISARIIQGEKLIVDQHPQLTFLFSDIVGCGELVRNMSTVEMVRLLGYTFMLQDSVAEFYHIHKLKTIGDAFFCVAGLEDVARKREAEQRKRDGNQQSTADDEDEKLDNQVKRMVSFAVVVQQLLGVDYVHYPERTDCFMESATSDLGRMDMVSMQMGIHCGNAIAGVVDVGRAPHFDCFGPSVNLASRMETTAPIDRLQISAPTYDLLKNVDKEKVFDWDPPKKTLVKGYGTLNTYTIKSTTLRVPEEIISRLRVDRAVRLRYFTEQGLSVSNDRPPDNEEDEGSGQSTRLSEGQSDP